MNRILIASALILGVTGFAAAENPTLYGSNYSASVLNQYGTDEAKANASLDLNTTASIAAPQVDTGSSLSFDIHSGR